MSAGQSFTGCGVVRRVVAGRGFVANCCVDHADHDVAVCGVFVVLLFVSCSLWCCCL